jgi:hypothetical protein
MMNTKCTLKLTHVDVFMFQIQHIKQQEGTSSDAVQQGEVSSSKPTILANEVFGPLLLEVCTSLFIEIELKAVRVTRADGRYAVTSLGLIIFPCHYKDTSSSRLWLVFDQGGECDVYLGNAGIHIQDYIVAVARKLQSEYSLP